MDVCFMHRWDFTDGIPRLVFYLHESVAFVDKWSVGDLLEGLADVWERLGLLDQGLVVLDQCQSYAEQDFRALVEQAIPNPQNGLHGNNNIQGSESFLLSPLCIGFKVENYT